MAAIEYCELCEVNPGTFYCQECNAYLCMGDIAQHEDLLSDISHHIELVSAQLIKPEETELSTNLLDTPFPSLEKPSDPLAPIQDSYSEGEEDIDTSEARAGIIPLCHVLPRCFIREEDASSIQVHTEKQTPSRIHLRTDAFVRRIFDSYNDIAQHYKLYKWMLRRKETEQLLESLSQRKDQVKAVGVYGCVDNCLQVISQILQLDKVPEINPEDSKEGIVAFCRPDLALLCLLFKAEEDIVYHLLERQL